MKGHATRATHAHSLAGPLCRRPPRISPLWAPVWRQHRPRSQGQASTASEQRGTPPLACLPLVLLALTGLDIALLLLPHLAVKASLPAAALARCTANAVCATSVIFAGYFMAWWVQAQGTTLRRVGSVMNSVRKPWCSALQLGHMQAVGHAVAWVLHSTAGTGDEAAAAQQAMGAGCLQPLLGVAIPLLVVGALNVLLLAVVEFRKVTSKAVALGLDDQGPGAAHPIMVQGAQDAARVAANLYLIAVNGTMALACDGYWPPVLACVALMGMGLLDVCVRSSESRVHSPPLEAEI